MKTSHHALNVCLALVLLILVEVGEGWVDPGDMLRYDPNTKTMVPEKPKAEPTREIQESGHCERDRSPVAPASCPPTEYHFYKRFIRSLLAHFKSELHLSDNIEEMQFEVLMKLTESDLAALNSYVSPTSKVAVQDVDTILTHLIKRVRLYREATAFEGGSTWLERLLQWVQDKADIIAPILAGFLVIYIFRQLSPAKAFVLGLVLLFIVGSVYEGINMYQQLEAEKLALQHKLATVPEHCNPEKVSVFRRFGWSLQVNLFGMDDPCKKYYELLMVDTRYQINPLQVTVSALGKVFVSMAKFGGSSLGLFYSKALEHFNFFEKIVFVAVTTIVSIVVVMYTCPALVFSIPSLMRSMRRPQIREMVENIPRDQWPPIQQHAGMQVQRSPSAIAQEKCSSCGNHQPKGMEQEVPLRSSPNKITIRSGNKCISIEDVEPVAIETPGVHVDVCEAHSDAISKANPPEILPEAPIECIENLK